MDSLRQYLNGLPVTEQAKYAKRCGTSLAYLRKAISVRPRLDGALARRLDEESGGMVSRCDLRPDVFGDAQQEASNG